MYDLFKLLVVEYLYELDFFLWNDRKRGLWVILFIRVIFFDL